MPELRVLVADDDPQLLDLMERRLKKLGLEPDRAMDGRAAKVLLENTKYDLVVTDIYMPHGTGLELLRLAKEQDPHIQVVVVTAAATMDNAVDALNEGAFGYMSKPFDHISVFDNMVSRAVELRTLILDNQRMAEAQRRRGDILEDEVTDRVGQLRQRQRELIDLLSALPEGVVVVEEGGRVILSSSVAEKWLAQEMRSGGQPIQRFIETAHDEFAEAEVEVEIGSDVVQLSAVDLPTKGENLRKVIIIRELEFGSIDTEERLRDPLTNLKKGVTWLYRNREQDESSDLIEYMLKQVSDLERLTGIFVELQAPGTSDLLVPTVEESVESADEQGEAEADEPQVEPDLEKIEAIFGELEKEMAQETAADQTAEVIEEVEEELAVLPEEVADESKLAVGAVDEDSDSLFVEILMEEKAEEGADGSTELDELPTDESHAVDLTAKTEPQAVSSPLPAEEVAPEETEEIASPDDKEEDMTPARRMLRRIGLRKDRPETKLLTEDEILEELEEGTGGTKELDEAFDTLISMLDDSEKGPKKSEQETSAPEDSASSAEVDEDGAETASKESADQDGSWPPPAPSKTQSDKKKKKK
jgi:DNA-binding response OmpR family regulator